MTATNEERLTDLETEVDRLTMALWGNRDRIREEPGVIAELRSVEGRQLETNAILREMRGDQRRMYWTIVVAIAGAAAKIFLGGGL